MFNVSIGKDAIGKTAIEYANKQTRMTDEEKDNFKGNAVRDIMLELYKENGQNEAKKVRG